VQGAVGLDVGTTSVKGIAVSADGDIIGRAEETYALSTPHPGWSEQDPQLWWDATQRVLGRLGTDEIAGIGLSGQMHGLVALDEDDAVLRPAILWNDQRTARQCTEIEDRLGLEKLIHLTGNRALTGFTAPKLLWLRASEPETYARIAHILLPKDYVRLRLTGERATDVADASGTLLFDVGHRRWSEDVVVALDIEPAWLPPASESQEVSGRTSDGIPVAAGAGDQAAGALGVGIDRPGALSIALGTSGVVFAALPEYTADQHARVHVFCHAVPGSWHAMGVMLSAAGSLRWFRDTLAPGADFDSLVAEAQAWDTGAGGVVFLPYLTGERTPHADADARAAFSGLAVHHNRGALVRAVLEGVAYGLRDSLKLLRALGVTAERARVSGGGTQSRAWLQIIASVLGLPLEVATAQEGAAYGAALLGGIAAGMFADPAAAIETCVSVRETIDPVHGWQVRYDEGYAEFRALYPALRSTRKGSA
jgi:xylulokinase